MPYAIGDLEEAAVKYAASHGIELEPTPHTDFQFGGLRLGGTEQAGSNDHLSITYRRLTQRWVEGEPHRRQPDGEYGEWLELSSDAVSVDVLTRQNGMHDLKLRSLPGSMDALLSEAANPERRGQQHYTAEGDIDPILAILDTHFLA